MKIENIVNKGVFRLKGTYKGFISIQRKYLNLKGYTKEYIYTKGVYIYKKSI